MNRRIVFLFSLSVVCATLVAVAGPLSVSKANDPSSGWRGEGWWMKRHQAKLAEIRASDGAFDLVMLGDSITHQWDDVGAKSLAKMREEFKVLNLGFGGDGTPELLWRMENGELDGYTAKAFMLMIGTNSRGSEDADIAEGIVTAIRLVLERHPESKVLVLPIFPTCRDPLIWLRTRLRRADARVFLDCVDDKRVFWCDFGAKFLEPDGSISTRMMGDYVHPAVAGYEIWREAIRPYLLSSCGRTASVSKDLTIQAAIDAVAAKGGGEVVVPRGTWETKPFVLRSRITLRLEKDAFVVASTNLADYAVGEGQRTFVSATDVEKVRIIGPGTFDGNGSAFRERADIPGESQPQRLPVMFRFTRCRDLTLEDFTYRRCGAWGCHLRNCDGVVMRHVTCFNHVNNTNDGIDIESRNVLIEDCDIDADDDAIVLKTESDKSFQVTNVVIRNCRLASCCNAFKFGTGSYCDFRDVTLENCEFRRPKASFRCGRREKHTGKPGLISGSGGIALEVCDGGRMENVTVRNVTIEGYLTPLFVRLERRRAPQAGQETYLRNILVESVKAVADSRIASSITGVPGLRPRDIVLRNCDFTFPGGGTAADAAAPVPELEDGYPDCHMFETPLPAWALYVRHADRVRFVNVKCRTLTPDARREIVLEDVGE